MKKAITLVLSALLAGCGAPAYVGDIYAGFPPLSPVGYESTVQAQSSDPAAPENPAQTSPDTTKKVTHVTASASVVQLLPERSQVLRGTVTYSDGTRDSNVTWSSSDQTIAVVNPTTGEVTGIRPGTATIQARAGADLHRFFNIPVMVRDGVVEDVFATIVAPRETVTPGDTLQLEARLTNSSASAHLNGRWASSNPQIAYVNEHGLVTARRPGQVSISFTSDQKSTVAGRVTLTVADPTAL